MTELSLLITKLLKYKIDYLVFDSLTNILTYEKKAPLVKFFSSIANKIKGSQTKAIFYALDIKEHESMAKQCMLYVDKTLKIP